MHKCTYTDRIELQRGKITRVVHANYESKKYSNEMDVYKQNEDGKNYCRNVYYAPMAGYGIVFKNEYISGSSYYYYCGFMDRIEPYAMTENKGTKVLPLYCSNEATEEDLKIITDKYEGFKYVLKKWDCRNLAIILEALMIWKDHKEIEILLSAGLENLAFTDAFYRLSDKKKNEIKIFLRNNLEEIKSYDLNYNEILSCVKNGYKPGDLYFLKRCKDYKFSEEETAYAQNKLSVQDLYSYRIYLNDLKYLGKNLDDEFWHYPSNFQKQKAKLDDEKIIYENNLDRMKEIRYQETVRQFSSHAGQIYGYDIFVPQNIEDIKYQAETLNQCLMTCNYTDKVINGMCVLVFMRKNGIPIATAEITSSNSIGQFYCNELERNEKMYPTDKMKKAMNIWLKNKTLLKTA